MFDNTRSIARLENEQDFNSGIEVGPNFDEIYTNLLGVQGLRGLWYPGNVTSNGNLPDMSGQGNALVDNIAGAVNVRAQMIPIYPFNGTSQYLSAANAAWNQIQGTEARVTPGARGLTMGGWFFNNSTAPANFKGLMSKWQDAVGNQRSYLLAQNTNGHFQAYISGNGTTQFSVDEGVIPASSWHFVVMRYTASAELAIFDNWDGVTGAKVVNTTSIPASLFNSTAEFEIGAYDAATATSFFAGFYSLAFLCCAALTDTLLARLFTRMRPFFAV